VTEVYVDVGAACIEAGFAHAPAATDPEAVRALRHLADAGVRVVVVMPNGVEPDADLRAVAHELVTALPERVRGPAWYLTSDIARCHGSSARLTTVLIGGAPQSGSIRRCDTVARDVQAAAMEILAAVAMAPGRTVAS
jgi:hypothetical protein